jgi:hypothetical protein
MNTACRNLGNVEGKEKRNMEDHTNIPSKLKGTRSTTSAVDSVAAVTRVQAQQSTACSQ